MKDALIRFKALEKELINSEIILNHANSKANSKIIIRYTIYYLHPLHVFITLK